MENSKFLRLPIIGVIQHGEQIIENGKKRIKDYGFFIAKTKNSNMQPYIDKFNKLLCKQKSIDIQLLESDSFSIQNARFNQSGKVCYCKENETIGKQKVNNLWKDIECNSSCIYLQKDEKGKKACNRIAWLKFFIPKISTDRIWLMLIKGQESINNIDTYLKVQKMQQNKLNGLFTMFLTQKEQVDQFGKTHNNFVLDIMRKQEIISNNSIPQTIEDSKDEPKGKNKKAENTNSKKIKEKENSKETKKKSTKSKSKKIIDIPIEEEPDIDKCYYLIGNHMEKFTKNGELKEYFVGDFNDMTDKPNSFVIKPELVDIINECGIGSVFELEIQEFKNNKIVTNLKFIQNKEKEIAA